MELTLLDRICILNMVLPPYDTRTNTLLKMSIGEKIKLSEHETGNLVLKEAGNKIEVGFKSGFAMPDAAIYEFTDEELLYMGSRVEYLDRTGMFSIEVLPTYDKILSASEGLKTESE